MNIFEAMQNRHAVRSYTDRVIDEETRRKLQDEVVACREESGLSIQMVTDEPTAFSGLMAHYGKFSGVRNYIVLAGKKSNTLHESIGYYGERIVLQATMLGLNTCWVALTFQKGKIQHMIEKGEKLVCVIPFGYGATQGKPHENRPVHLLCDVKGEMPTWFHRGLDAAMLAPTANNQQKFKLSLLNNTVKAESTGGFYSDVDLGIVKYHFEIAAEKKNFKWAS